MSSLKFIFISTAGGLTLSVQFRWSKDVESHEMDGQWILMNAQDFTVTKFEGLGGFIWSHFREPSTKERIVELILEAYDATREQVEMDVNHFVNHLLHLRLLDNSQVEFYAT